MINKKLSDNPLQNRKDAENALLELIKPLEKHFETSEFGLKYDSGGAHCSSKVREVEALLRPLWGIIPMLAGGTDYKGLRLYLKKMINGTNPRSPSYWGNLTNKDQLMVEMGSIGTGLCFAKENLWDVLTDAQRKNLYDWLDQINHFEMPMTNWLFFRILVNLGLKNCGLPFKQKQIDSDLAGINSYYIGQGWYFDGYEDQIDYYIPFAFHFYGLLYVKAVDDGGELYSKLFTERSIAFAKTFQYFFTNDGVAVPYGRSLTYRFAQSAFWGVLAFAGVEALPWGRVRHLALGNLRHWFRQPIFSASNEMTIGYYYRNLVMAEGYNAFGSPYWALKSFIFLALDAKDPFWATTETTGNREEHVVIPQMRAILKQDTKGNHIQMFTVGQHCEAHAHVEAKYEKFVYSTKFGFSVSKGMLGLSQGAFDNTLAVSEDGRYFKSRYGVENYEVKDEYLTSTWKPFSDVIIKTYIIPLFPWHVRIHEVYSNRDIVLADGGFAIDNSQGFEVFSEGLSISATAWNTISAIKCVIGDVVPEIIYAEPNTNIYFEKSAIPTVKKSIVAGIHFFATAVLGSCDADDFANEPKVEVTQGGYLINFLGKVIFASRN